MSDKNKTTAHTPGPWRVRIRQAKLPGDEPMGIVALDIFCKDKMIGAATIRPHLPSEANAYLMAAAPELFDALRAVYEWAERHHPHRIFEDFPADKIENVFQKFGAQP